MNDRKHNIKYYVWEIEMPKVFADHLRQIAVKENMTLEEMTEKALMRINEHPEILTAWKLELDAIPPVQP